MGIAEEKMSKNKDVKIKTTQNIKRKMTEINQQTLWDSTKKFNNGIIGIPGEDGSKGKKKTAKNEIKKWKPYTQVDQQT